MADTLDALQNADPQTASTLTPSTTSTGKIKEPSKKDIVGILLSADTIEIKGKQDVVIISMQDVDDNVTTLTTSPAYWAKVGKLFPPDTICKISFEQRIAGSTGYKDDNGKMVAHTSDGNNLVGITRFSSIAFQRMMDEQSKSSDIAVISSVEVDRVGAVAQYLSAYVKR